MTRHPLSAKDPILKITKLNLNMNLPSAFLFFDQDQPALKNTSNTSHIVIL